jgi:hypothetical protein
MRNLLSFLLLSVSLVLSASLARSEGIYNPGSNSVGDYQGIDNPKPASGSSLACSYTPVTTGTQGVAYTGATPSASGGTPAYTFSETGTLPGGLTISSSTGVISGTPTANGSFPTIQVKVTDSTSTVANCGASFTLVIAAPPFSLTYESSIGSSDTTNTTVDYGTLSYGSGNTRVIVAVQWVAGGAITGVTVGGVALAQVSGAFNNLSASFRTDAWESTSALAGTSGDVQVTYASAVSFTSVVALYNLVTTTPTSSGAVQGNQAFGTTVATSSAIGIPTGGGAIVMVIGGGTGFAFSNATLDAAVVAGGQTQNWYGHTTSTGSVTPGASWTGNNVTSITAVAWGP